MNLPLLSTRWMHAVCIALGLTFVCHCQAVEKDELSSVVKGLRDSRTVVLKYPHPVASLCSLRVSDPTAVLTPSQRYQLARQLLDVHHLCMALSHQSYRVEPANAPILKLAERAFPGFKKLNRRDGGYRTSDMAEFFEKNGPSGSRDESSIRQLSFHQKRLPVRVEPSL